MTDLKLFRPDADSQNIELQGSTVALEVELQRRNAAGMEAMLGSRFLASEYPTGADHIHRIELRNETRVNAGHEWPVKRPHVRIGLCLLSWTPPRVRGALPCRVPGCGGWCSSRC
ncbi:hypothetical protein ACIHEJ_10640 [Streptomyces sp. NPDC052301]|uniref:hypothetical protein n=1 Tax=Streptomyces sp. NPDC052301 TaxID=3365687 RepID=UPI0037D87ED2